MMERIAGIGYPPNTGQFNKNQAVLRQQLTRLPDDVNNILGAAHSVRVIPSGETTLTYVNPLDPAGDDGGWIDIPHGDGPVVPAGRMY
jgi:hypothetical protein